MILLRENNKILSDEQVAQLKRELLAVRTDSKIPTLMEDQLTQELGNYYTQGHKADLATHHLIGKITTPSGDAHFNLVSLGKSILEKIKEFICKVLRSDSTTSDIIDAILTAISSLIPGGVLIKPILQKLVKYILLGGIDKFCGFTTAK